MRPVSLSISGLHSFREERTIDFDPLLRENLFGIFGPTGSGKSTILDAMTLALFGRINRLNRSEVAGALNAITGECRVTFTFDVDHAGERNRYEVQRHYRTKGRKSMASSVRLTLLGDEALGTESIVLADKGKLADEMVRDLLGIADPDDFSRAVIIPQGSFADFLEMRLEERGKMLRRIFGLEELGDRIDARMSAMRSAMKESGARLEGKMESLLPFTDELLVERERDVERLRTETAEAGERHRAGDARLDERRRTFESIVERDRLRAGEPERATQRERVATLRDTLARDERALAIRVEVTQAAAAIESEAAARTAFDAAATRLQAAETIHLPLKQRMEELAGDDDADGESGRLAQLDDEIVGLKELAAIEARIAEMTKSVRRRAETIERGTTALTAAEKGETSWRAKEETLGKEKEEIDAALDEARRRKEDAERKRSLWTPIVALATDHERKSAERERLTARERDEQEREKRLIREITEARAVEAEAIAAVDEARAAVTRGRAGNVLIAARELLLAGEPCPLCGSLEHPAPYKHHDADDLSALTTLLEEKEAALKRATEARHAKEVEEGAVRQAVTEIAGQCEILGGEIAVIAERMTLGLAETSYKGATDLSALRDGERKFDERIADMEARIADMERTAARLTKDLDDARTEAERHGRDVAVERQRVESAETERVREEAELTEEIARRADTLAAHGITIEEGIAAVDLLARRETERTALADERERLAKEYRISSEEMTSAREAHRLATTATESAAHHLADATARRDEALSAAGFASVEEWRGCCLDDEGRRTMRAERDEIDAALRSAEERLAELERATAGAAITADEIAAEEAELAALRTAEQEANRALGEATNALDDCRAKNRERITILAEQEEQLRRLGLFRRLDGYLKGNAFIEFIANERLRHICRTASTQLMELTGGRLAIDAVPTEGFIVIDHGNGGVNRPTSSLSGGETFLVSLSLALALSESLQLRGAPLEFFFLDEGFGTLDAEMLETVMDALDRLRLSTRRAIGVISHIGALKERIPRRLIITPADELCGSDVRIELT